MVLKFEEVKLSPLVARNRAMRADMADYHRALFAAEGFTESKLDAIASKPAQEFGEKHGRAGDVVVTTRIVYATGVDEDAAAASAAALAAASAAASAAAASAAALAATAIQHPPQEFVPQRVVEPRPLTHRVPIGIGMSTRVLPTRGYHQAKLDNAPAHAKPIFLNKTAVDSWHPVKLTSERNQETTWTKARINATRQQPLTAAELAVATPSMDATVPAGAFKHLLEKDNRSVEF
jgi:hypothetical protein